MEKNKNRTDLLAAGRKKLQQYRQKKDGKGSKSSGKSNKPDRDVATDESSSKSSKGKKQLPDSEPPAQDSATELVDDSSSTDNLVATNADVASPDLSSTTNSPIEVSEADGSVGASVPQEHLESSNPGTVNIEGKHESGFVPMTPVGLKAVLIEDYARKAGELNAARGEDQVPDVGTLQEHNNSRSESDNQTSSIEVDVNPGDVEEDTNPDLHSASEVPFSDPEPTIQPKADVVANFHGDESIKLPPIPVESEYTSPVSGVIAAADDTPLDLTELAKVFQNLGEDEFRFLMAARESVNGGDFKSGGDMKADSAEFSERLKEQLYINNLEKELIYLELRKEYDQHRVQCANEKSGFSASLGDVEGKNKILSEELTICRSELDRVTSELEKLQMIVSSSKTELDQSVARIQELQNELEKSEHQLSNVSSELVDTRSLLSDLQAKNENLNVNISSLTKEKEDVVVENEKLMKELAEFKSLLESSVFEKVNSKESLALAMEDKATLEEEKQKYVYEKEALEVEITKLNELLASEREERSKLEEANDHFAHESKKFSEDLSESQHLVESLRSENNQFVHENKKFSEDLSESQQLVESLRLEISNLQENLDMVTKERTRLQEEMNELTVEREAALSEVTNCKTTIKDLQVEYEKSMNDLKDKTLQLDQLTEENVTLTSTLDMYKTKIMEFDDEKLKSEHKAFQEKLSIEGEDSSGLVAFKKRLINMEKAMQELDKVVAGMSDGKAVSPGVSKLVRNFESKGQTDESEENASGEDSELHLTAKKELDNLKDLFHDLVLNVEHASELFNVERSGKTFPDNKLEEQSNILEEKFFEHIILDEVVKQYVSTIEAKKGELEALCGDLRQEGIIAKMKNSELTENLNNSESRICQLQVQVDHMASINDQLETLQQKLDASIGTISNTTSSETDVITRVATSVDSAVSLIQDLDGKLKEALQNYNLISDYNKDLEGRNELSAYVIHKVFDNLQKLVNDSGTTPEESEDDTRSGQLDQLEISNYDVFIERLIMVLRERAQLEVNNRRYNLELLQRIKDLEEFKKKCIHRDVIVKLLVDIQSVVNLKDFEVKLDEPMSSLESILHILVTKNKSAEEQVGLHGENLKAKEMKLIEFKNEMDSVISYVIESRVFKESLRSAMEQLVSIRSETLLKETELHQSEQRVSALREKLHIAVTKGKGLIQQRDSLKQNLTATSTALQETETKLKAYSEAGERMEALESELSYIRNSATALRESFLLKDSVLQRIEEILEDLELPEDFHDRDIIDKIDWLAKSVSRNSFPVNSSSQPIPLERSRSFPDVLEPSLGSGDEELRRNYEELQNKFYGLAEHNEMLEQSLMERNNLVQRWEEILENINIPPQLRSLEPEDRIEWLSSALSEANDRCESLQRDIYELENSCESLAADLEESRRRVVELEAALKSITNEREQLSASLEVQSLDYSKLLEKAALYETENDKLQKEVGGLKAKLDEKHVEEEHVRRLQDVVKDMLQVSEIEDLDSSTSDIGYLEGLLRKLAENYSKHSETSGLTQEERSVDQSTAQMEFDLAVLERKLEETEGDLVRVKDEKDNYVEKTRSLVHEMEALDSKIEELQNALVQEEQKSQSLVHEIEGLDLKNQELQKLLVQEEQKNQSLVHEIEGLDLKNQELQELLVQEEQKNQSLVHENEALDSKNQELQKLLVQEEQRSQFFVHEIEALGLKNQEVQKSLDQEEQKNHSFVHEIEALSLKNQEVQKLLVQADQKNQEFQNLVVQEEQKNQSLVHEIEVLDLKNRELQKLLVQEEQKNLSPVHEIEALGLKNQELQKLIVQGEQKNQSLVHEIEALDLKNQEIQKLLVQEEQKNQSFVHEFEALDLKNQELQKLLVQEEQTNQSSVHEIEALDLKKQELQALLVQEEQKNQSLVHEIEASDLKNRELQKLLVQEEQKNQSNQSLVHEFEALDLRNQELEKLLVQEEQKHQSNQSLVHKVEALELKIQELQKLLVQEEQKNQSSVREIEALDLKNQELQKLLAQEEQKTATVREKLNVAVRKGKSLVQQRDGMKQTINELTSQVERLTSEIKVRENTILEHQQKMTDLITSQEAIDDKDTEIRFLKDRMNEAEVELQDKTTTLSTLLGVLAEINLGVESRTNDPVEKIQQIEKVFRNLQEAISSAEQDSRKSKRAAELLLAELNEIQERNEDLVEELSKTNMEISKLSKECDSAEAAKRESFSRLERLSALHSEERSSQLSELMTLKSELDQLKPGVAKIHNLLNDILPKDLDHLYNLEADVKSLLESSDASNVGSQTLRSSRGGISSRSDSKGNFFSGLFFKSETEELHDDSDIHDLWRFIGSRMQDLATKISNFEEKLLSHSKCLHEEVIVLSESMLTIRKEMTSDKHSLESAKEEISWLESTGKQKDTENLVLRKYISMLYEACKSSVFEIEKSKGEVVSDDSSDDILSGETLSVSEERIMTMVNRLLSLVKDIHSIQAENVEVNLKEMKATISSLQKELTEKDVQKDRISVELVGQIKRAEAAAMSHLQELESAKAQIHDLKEQLEAVNLERNELEQRVNEQESEQSIVVDLDEKVKSLTSALTAKEQEAEALLQALDEEEAQMEDLTNKVNELTRLVQQKESDLESAEAARGKALKKLSITVSKFDELHHLSETLVTEVDNLQSQLQERDSEISFLREEITRCTSDSLLAIEIDKKGLNEIRDIMTWLNSMISGVEMDDVNLDENASDKVHEVKEILKKQITSIVSELKDLRQMAQSKDDLLLVEKSKVEELMRGRELLENSLREKEARLSVHENDGDSTRATSMTSEIVEVEPLINKWPLKGTSMASQVRSLRKVNNDQLAISIDDMDSDDKDKLEDEDDDKAHGFKSLTTSRIVPKFTRPVTNFIDGLWVSCDRALMRQPVLRLSLILYWALMHALLAVFVV